MKKIVIALTLLIFGAFILGAKSNKEDKDVASLPRKGQNENLDQEIMVDESGVKYIVHPCNSFIIRLRCLITPQIIFIEETTPKYYVRRTYLVVKPQPRAINGLRFIHIRGQVKNVLQRRLVKGKGKASGFLGQ